MTTAEIIAAQIGKRALLMMGAHSLSSSKDALSFRVRGSKKANAVRVVYESGSDLYTVEAFKLVGTNIRRTTEEGVHVESLHNVIEALTGLCLSL